MVHEIKNIETKLPRLGIHIKLGAWLAGLAMVALLIKIFGTSVSAGLSVYLFYRIFRLAMRLLGQIFSIAITAVSILILITIISLIII
jgi:hypothetical protein